MNILEKIKNIKRSAKTKYAVYKILKYIKKSQLNAYTIGNEIVYIYYILYNIYKVNEGEYSINDNFYKILSNDRKYNTLVLSNILSKDILYNEFFTKLNIKIFKLDSIFIWYFIRGYYINDLEIFSVNLNKYNKSYCVIYDFHIHYITFIYEFLSSMHVNNINITLELNNSFDIYSLNDITDGINYKLIMNHTPSDINNPILDLLDLFYNNIHYKEELYRDCDINLFKKYKIYKP